MDIEFTDTETESSVNGVKVMVYAPAGTGKTMLVATCPAPILISAESGLLSLSRRNIEKVFGAGREDISYNIPVIKVKTIEDLNNAYEWCLHNAAANGFKTVALDSITEIFETILAHAKKVYKDPRQAYGELATLGVELMKKFRDLEGLNVYFSAKLAPFKDEMANITKYGPGAPGSKLSVDMPYLFDELLTLRIGRDEDGNSYRYIQTQPDIQYEAKDRSGTLDNSEWPEMGAIFNKISEGVVVNYEATLVEPAVE